MSAESAGSEPDEDGETATSPHWSAKVALWFRQHVGLSVLFLSLAAGSAVAIFGVFTWEWLVQGEPQGESNGATIRNLGLLFGALVSGFLVAWRNSTAGREADAAQTQARAMQLQAEAALRTTEAALETASRQTEAAQRQVETAQRDVAQERFQAATALLSSDSLRDRLNAIETLRVVAHRSREHHLEIVVQTLCTFARHPDGRPEEPDESDAATTAGLQEALPAREDVVAAVRAAASLLKDVADRAEGSELRLDLNGIRLAGADLSSIDLTHASLVAADLRGADLSRANLNQANLHRAHLADANLARVWAQDAFLGEADLARANLNRANASGADFIRAALANSNFARVDLRDARLDNANLTDASFLRARLHGARLWGAIAVRVNFTRAILDGASLMDARLVQANFGRAQLVEADLSGSVLTRANFTNANLTRADLSKADLSQVRLVSANVTSTWFAVEDWDISSDVDAFLGYFVAEGLTQQQLNRAIAEPEDPPHVEQVVDAATGEPLEWRGGPMPEDADDDEDRTTS